MYKQFQFEGPVHQELDCVPLCPRRKLDLAGLKLSLAGWQAMTRAERLALCHLPVESPEDLETYREVLRGFAARAGTALSPLQDPDATGRIWNAPEIPALLAGRLGALGVKLDAASWRALDEESRYALCKLAVPKRNPLKLHAACVELGLLPGPAPVIT